MPKAYISIFERKAAQQDKALKADIWDGIYRKVSYIELAEKSGHSPFLIQKAMHHPELLRITDLRRILNAAGMELSISASVCE